MELEVMAAARQIDHLRTDLRRRIIPQDRHQFFPLTVEGQILLHLEKHGQRHPVLLAGTRHPCGGPGHVLPHVTAAVSEDLVVHGQHNLTLLHFSYHVIGSPRRPCRVHVTSLRIASPDGTPA